MKRTTAFGFLTQSRPITRCARRAVFSPAGFGDLAFGFGGSFGLVSAGQLATHFGGFFKKNCLWLPG